MQCPGTTAVVLPFMPLRDHPRLLELTDAEILALPVDRLGLEILTSFGNGSSRVHRHNYFNSWGHAGVRPGGDVWQALLEGYDWLTHHGLIAEHNQADGFITRLGRDVLERA